ncbi:MAG: hypothetical protein II561_01125 [Thermoguttaceae bacterium]|nr:hypothetical protein [Thermoguttaceae bacterium]
MSSKVRLSFYLLILLALIAATCTSLQAPGAGFWSTSGIWSVLPPLVAILLAVATRNVVVSLLVGLFSAAYLMALQKYGAPGSAALHTFNIASAKMLEVVAKPGNAGILLQCGAIGGLVALLAASGGIRAVAELFVKLARGPASSQIVTWILGIFIFFDDYANVQIRGPIVRPITDRNRVSREKLSFILDATAAPIAGIALISTWIGTELTYIESGLTDAGLDTTYQAYGLFVSSIPYRFYNLLMLAFILLSAWTLRDFGAMYKAEVLARKGYLRDMNLNLVTVEEAMNGASDGLAVDDATADAIDGVGAEKDGDYKEGRGVNKKRPTSNLVSALFALVPLLVLVFAAFGFFYTSGRAAILESGDAGKIAAIEHISASSVRDILGAADAAISIFQAALLAGIVAFIMSVLSKRTSASEAVGAWLNGVKSLVFTFVILILAWSLASCIGKDGLGTAKFLVGALSNETPAFLLPSLIFVLAAIVSFSTGTSYGTMAIITPLAIPFANALAPGDYSYLVVCTSAVLTGAIFGDHSSPISDTTILSATSARCGMLEHVGTQLEYALWVGAVAVLFGFLPVGCGLSIKLALPLALLATFALLMIRGKRVPDSGE